MEMITGSPHNPDSSEDREEGAYHPACGLQGVRTAGNKI